MESEEQKKRIFEGLYLFDSPFINEFFDEEDTYCFESRFDVNAAYKNVRNWLQYAVIKKADYIFSFGTYQGYSVEYVLQKDAQYIEYCIREVDRFFFDKQFLENMIDEGWVFNEQTIKSYRQKLNDLKAAQYIQQMWKTLDARIEQSRQNEFDRLEDNWLSRQIGN